MTIIRPLISTNKNECYTYKVTAIHHSKIIITFTTKKQK